MRRWGLKARLTFWHAAGLGVILATTFTAADWLLWRTVRNQVDATLVALAHTEAASAFDGPVGAEVHLHDLPRPAGDPVGRTVDKLVQIRDLDGRLIARSANLGDSTLPVSPAVLSRVRNRETVLETLADFAGESVRMISLPIADGRGTRYMLQLATSLGPAQGFLGTTRVLRIVVSLTILGLVTATGALLARSALQPINAMVAMAQRIDESNLRERLPHPGTADEIGHLVDTLNGMLDRLERSVAVQSRFTADAAHELRSPLSRLRSELEVSLRRPRDPAVYQAVLESCLDEVVRLSRLTDDLLLLARLDAGERHGSRREKVAVDLVVADAVRRWQTDADRKNVTIVVEPPLPRAVAVADCQLAHVIGNLLDNAIKFSRPGGSVRVGVASTATGVRLSVSDTGPGIAPEDLPRVFERFYRGDASRSSDIAGVGLGLAICRAIIEAHGGSIAIASTPGGGTTVTVRLPRAA